MATLKKLKQIDNRFKYAVFGYVRSMESQLSHYNVPVLISYVVLSYYFHGEYFAKYGDKVQLSNDRMTVTKIIDKSMWNKYNNTTYGNIWIESNVNQIAKWKLKLSSNNVWISILSKDDRINEHCLQSMDEPLYGFGTVVGGGYAFSYREGSDGECEQINTGSRFASFHDNITLTLNTKDRTISFKNVEDTETIIMFKNIKRRDDIRYINEKAFDKITKKHDKNSVKFTNLREITMKE